MFPELLLNGNADPGSGDVVDEEPMEPLFGEADTNTMLDMAGEAGPALVEPAELEAVVDAPDCVVVVLMLTPRLGDPN